MPVAYYCLLNDSHACLSTLSPMTVQFRGWDQCMLQTYANLRILSVWLVFTPDGTIPEYTYRTQDHLVVHSLPNRECAGFTLIKQTGLDAPLESICHPLHYVLYSALVLIGWPSFKTTDNLASFQPYCKSASYIKALITRTFLLLTNAAKWLSTW